ncbi:MAG: DUF2924 domain-containing protein [Acidobacteria bacterium]|nr:MAG: DUF2924 domain-containing protein [Acidobacteriota bacterium]MCE7957365.1 DUF2924 domain-containing protein [Acidobacteria bacterium ACB2]
MASRTSNQRADRANVAATAAKLAALGRMTGPELAAQYETLFGAPPRSRNRQYLRKRLAYRIQELAEGGLSPRALDRIDQLIRLAPPPWRRPAAGSHGLAAQPRLAPATRDPRLPSPGTVLTRIHRGVEHRVTVLVDGFEYRDERYRSLSKIARKITGTPWNGFLFFFGRSGGTRKLSEGSGA